MTEQSIDVLKADPQNARTISAEALAGLGVSMQTFGDLSGIVFNQRSGRLVAGHQRMEQLRAAGAKTWRRTSKAEGVIVHPKTEERFPVRIVEWDDTTERLANLAANNPEIQGSFTAEALAQLKALDAHVDFEGLRLDDLYETLEADIRAAETPGGGNTDPDDVPEPPKVPITQPADLWILGDHRLLCGDSTKAEDVARVLGKQRAALGLHDPPYGMGAVEMGFGDGRRHGNAAAPRGRFRPIKGDDRPFDPSHLLATSKVVVLWGANHYADKLPPRPAWLVWDKRVDLPSNDFSDCELAWVSQGTRAKIIRHTWNGMIRDSERGERRVHPTQKPVAVHREIIEAFTGAGEVVLDCYLGSGTTLLAAEQIGRVCVGLEIEPAYCDVIVTRWEAFTGRKATRQPAAKADAPARSKPRGKPRRK